MEPVYYCKHCKFCTKTVKFMKQHILTKKHSKLSNNDECIDNYNKQQYKCLECHRISNVKSNIVKHIKTIHSIEKKNKTTEFIDILEKMPDKSESFRLLKVFLASKDEIREKDNEIKQIYKEENEYHKKLANNAGNIVDKTISAFTHAVTNYKDAPRLKLLDSKTANKLLCQEKINGKIVKLDNNKTAEYIAKLSEQKILPKHLSNTLIEQYKMGDPREQSVWTTDASRMKMIVKMDDSWIRDGNGKIINEHMIVPLINEMVRIIDQYNTSNGMNIGKMTRAQELKYAEVAMRILDIKLDVSSERINKEILKCIMPEFIMKRSDN